jgi:hypothetical protein
VPSHRVAVFGLRFVLAWLNLNRQATIYTFYGILIILVGSQGHVAASGP